MSRRKLAWVAGAVLVAAAGLVWLTRPAKNAEMRKIPADPDRGPVAVPGQPGRLMIIQWTSDPSLPIPDVPPPEPGEQVSGLVGDSAVQWIRD
jgi:hypothetical protein